MAGPVQPCSSRYHARGYCLQVLVAGHTLDFVNGSPAAGRPAVVISARGGGDGPGAPNHGLDHVVPSLEVILGHTHSLGRLDVTTVTPELILAPHTPGDGPLIPLHKASLAGAHEQAQRLARTLGEHTAA